MVFIPDDVWNIVKEFMLDWKKSHKLKLNNCLEMKCIKSKKYKFWKHRSIQGIVCQYPKRCISRHYDRKTYYLKSYWRIPWRHALELRIETLTIQELVDVAAAEAVWG